MTGAERLEQVREALRATVYRVEGSGLLPPVWAAQVDGVLAALDGCVLLTAEEAENVRAYVKPNARDAVRALLTPDQEASDE